MAKEKRVSEFVKLRCTSCGNVQDHVNLGKIWVTKRYCHYCGWDELEPCTSKKDLNI
jgi:ribosomal protein S27E